MRVTVLTVVYSKVQSIYSRKYHTGHARESKGSLGSLWSVLRTLHAFILILSCITAL